MSRIVKIIIAVVAVLAILGAAAGVVAWTQSDKYDQKDLSHVGRYDVGALDSNGNYMSVNTSIYTKKPIECQGLNCTLSFDSVVSYEIFFYDQNNVFVHRTGKLTGAFVEDSVPFFVKFARIVITPNDDDKVTSLEVSKYAKQLTVKVNREQGFKNYTDNLVKVGALDMAISSETGEDVENLNDNNMVSEFINVSSYEECLTFRVGKYTDLTNSVIYLYDNQKKYVGYAHIVGNASIAFTSSEGTIYYNLPLDKIHFRYIRRCCFNFNYYPFRCSLYVMSANIEIY